MIENVNDYGKVCNFCTIYLILLDIVFLITRGIGCALIYFFSIGIQKKVVLKR